MYLLAITIVAQYILYKYVHEYVRAHLRIYKVREEWIGKFYPLFLHPRDVLRWWLDILVVFFWRACQRCTSLFRLGWSSRTFKKCFHCQSLSGMSLLTNGTGKVPVKKQQQKNIYKIIITPKKKKHQPQSNSLRTKHGMWLFTYTVLNDFRLVGC